MTYSLADRAAAEGCPMLEVRRVALNDGSHASLILENGRISKLVSPSGEVARLHWEDDKPSPRPPSSFTNPVAETAARWGAPKAQEDKAFVSARQFWASLPDAPTGPRKFKGIPEDRSSVTGCTSSGQPSDTSEVTSPSPKASSEASALHSITAQTPQPEAGSQAEVDTGSNGQSTRGNAQQHGSEPCCVAHTLPGVSNADAEQTMEADPPRTSAQQDTFQPPGSSTAGGSAAADVQTLTEDSSAADGCSGSQSSSRPTVTVADTASLPALLQRKSTERHEDKSEPCAAAAGAQVSGQQRTVDPTDERRRQSAEARTLEALMGDAPKLDMRRMRAEVAGLPQLVSAKERAEIAAGARVRRSSRPVQQRRQPPPPPAAQRPVHSDGDAWPARSVIFEPSHIGRQPAAEMPAPATAQLQPQPQPQPRQQQGQQREHEEQPTPEEARRGSAGVSSGESVDSPAAAGGGAGSASGESADGSTATGPSAHSVTSAARRRHSLADIRRAIAALPSGAAGQPHPSAGMDLAAALLVPATVSTTEKNEGKAKTSGKPTVWRKITAAFNARRVQPQDASDAGSPAARPGSPSSSCSSSGSMTKRSLMQRIFRGRGFSRRASACDEAHLPEATDPVHSPLDVRPPPVAHARPITPPSPLGEAYAGGATSAQREQREGKRHVDQEVATPTSISSRSSARRRASHHEKAFHNRTGMAGRWRLEPCKRALAGMEEVERLLDLPLLQRLAMHRANELEILETDEALTIVQDIPLNGSGARIRRCSVYAKSGAVVEETRADSREGVLRSQLTISPDGHCHIRSLQGDPYAAVFHKRIKMSSGGHRIKVEQKFQLLAPGVLPVKYHSIWHRVEDENSATSANAARQQNVVL